MVESTTKPNRYAYSSEHRDMELALQPLGLILSISKIRKGDLMLIKDLKVGVRLTICKEVIQDNYGNVLGYTTYDTYKMHQYGECRRVKSIKGTVAERVIAGYIGLILLFSSFAIVGATSYIAGTLLFTGFLILSWYYFRYVTTDSKFLFGFTAAIFNAEMFEKD